MLGIVGTAAAAFGAYMIYAPANWVLAGIPESWYFGMFVGASILLAAAFGVFARRGVYLVDRSWRFQTVLGTA